MTFFIFVFEMLQKHPITLQKHLYGTPGPPMTPKIRQSVAWKFVKGHKCEHQMLRNDKFPLPVKAPNETICCQNEIAEGHKYKA